VVRTGAPTAHFDIAHAKWRGLLESVSTSYGPIKTLADSLGERREQLRRAWIEFFETSYRTNGGIAHTRVYLLVIGKRL
jgi:hypothetical protein